jgi:glycosyltransferase involved in cell wall biosynthesis
MKESIDLSVIIPVTERSDNPIDLYFDYKKAVQSTGLFYEVIFVVAGGFPDVLNALKGLVRDGEKITVIAFAKWFGEAVALDAGFKHATGNVILTLPAYQQISSSEIPRILDALQGCDMVLARRWPRKDSAINRFQSATFNFLLRQISDLRLHDVGCGVRAFKRDVIDEVYIYGDLHRFLPIMAFRHGFRIKELKVSQSDRDVFQRVYPFGLYVRRVLDLFTIFFLIRFTKKPLRFFGLIGLTTFGIGLLLTIYLVVERLFFGVSLSDRPALIISSLFIVLGAQILAMGLIGEILIFTHAKEIKEYKIDEIIN